MSKFQSGQPKPPGSGRQAGVVNRRTALLEDLLENEALDIPRRILDLLPQLPPSRQLDALLGLMPYIFPRRGSVAMSAEQTPSTSHLDEFQAMSNQELRLKVQALVAKGNDAESTDRTNSTQTVTLPLAMAGPAREGDR